MFNTGMHTDKNQIGLLFSKLFHAVVYQHFAIIYTGEPIDREHSDSLAFCFADRYFFIGGIRNACLFKGVDGVPIALFPVVATVIVGKSYCFNRTFLQDIDIRRGTFVTARLRQKIELIKASCVIKCNAFFMWYRSFLSFDAILNAIFLRR